MTSSRTRLSIALTLILAMAGLTSSAGSATAAQPNEGRFVYADYYGNGGYYRSIEFVVRGKPRKVKDFEYSNFDCTTIEINKAMRVNAKGKFRFKGTATAISGGGGESEMPVVLKGKFIRPNKARVSIDVPEDDSSSCADLSRAVAKQCRPNDKRDECYQSIFERLGSLSSAASVS